MFTVETIMNPAFGLCHALTPDSDSIQFGMSDSLRIKLIFKEPIDSTVLYLTNKEDRYGISFYGLGKIQSAHRVTIIPRKDYNVDITQSEWQHLRFKLFTTYKPKSKLPSLFFPKKYYHSMALSIRTNN